MKNQQIKALVRIADTGSIRAAAREMNLSQSALTRAMRELEEDVGAELLTRSYRGVTFTPAGTALLQRARLILETIDRARDEVRQITGGSGGKVTIGITPVVATTLLPSIYGQFVQKMPEVNMKLTEGLLTGIIPDLLEGRLDFGVAIATQNELPQELIFNPLCNIECCAAGRAAHPLAGETEWAILCQGRWILNLTPGSSANYLLSWLDRHGLPRPKKVVHCTSTLLMLEMMRRTDLIGFGPSLLLKDSMAAAGLTTFEITPKPPESSLGIIRVRGVPLTPAAQFLETLFLRKTIG
jgi:molybdate transport repressor ModE-like protein